MANRPEVPAPAEESTCETTTGNKTAGKKHSTGEAHASAQGEADSGVASLPAAPDTTPAGTPGKREREREQVPEPEMGFPIIGIGASAGGLQATMDLFDAMPDSPGMAFVVVQHLSPDQPSLTAELLAHHTAMQVTEVDDAPEVRPNCVYVIPPNADLAISGGKLQLTQPHEPRHGRLPINFFLRSLAEDQHERAVSIILSGTGSDGTLGTRAVKQHGGLTIVQDPTSAGHAGMPSSAIGTREVDYILPPHQIPEILLRYAQHPYLDGEFPVLIAGEKHSESLGSILALLRTQERFDFRAYKRTTLARRTARRMSLHEIESPDEYLDYLREHPDELNALVRDLLISVTDFFRDPEGWEQVRRQVVVPLLEGRADDETIRVWVPGCATGEEAYSIAMLMLEECQRSQMSCPIQVFATDVAREAVEFAREGEYPASIEADLSPERLRRFFTRLPNEKYRVNKLLRECVTFAEQNLISDPPFSRLDLVCCRNVLIYLEPDVQQKIIALFHFALREGGFLFLGNAETIGRQKDLFQTISQRWRIFRRIGRTRHDRVQFPVPADRPAGDRAVPAPPVERRDQRLAALVQQRVMDQFAPACVLVNARFEIAYFCGPTDRYLTQPPGIPTQNLLDRAREGLRASLRGAVHKVVTDRQPIVVNARIRTDGAFQPVRIMATPVHERHDNETLALVMFHDVEEAANPRDDAESNHPAGELDDESALRNLEDELTSTRSDLQNSIEQLETSNEEYKAANEEVMSINEELQSTNEELETSKEELQSLNEELNTVNTQLNAKVLELETSNNDLNNLLSSTDIATVCLDADFRIKWFTPAMTQLVNLLSTDVGRPISDFAHRFTDPRLREDAQQVLAKLTPIEAEVRTEDGRTLIKRVRPYRTEDNRILGVVVTFTDISHLKKAEEDLRKLAASLERQVEQRTWCIRLMQDVAVIANEAESVEDALRHALERVCSQLGWPVGHAFLPKNEDPRIFVSSGIWYLPEPERFAEFRESSEKMQFRPGEGLVGKVVASGKLQWLRDVLTDPDFIHRDELEECAVRSAFAFPILVHDDVVGVLEFFACDVTDPDESLVEGMSQFGTQLGRVVERQRMKEEIAEASAHENRVIGQELHDTVTQEIVGIGMLAEQLSATLKKVASPDATRAERIATLLRETNEHIRQISHTLMPVEVQPADLQNALAMLAKNTQELHEVRCRFECPNAVTLESGSIASHMYRIAREAVQNAVRHAGASEIVIRLTAGDDLVLEISDNGRGLKDDKAEGMGLRIIRYRANLIGANVQFNGRQGKGSSVCCSVPLPR